MMLEGHLETPYGSLHQEVITCLFLIYNIEYKFAFYSSRLLIIIQLPPLVRPLTVNKEFHKMIVHTFTNYICQHSHLHVVLSHSISCNINPMKESCKENNDIHFPFIKKLLKLIDFMNSVCECVFNFAGSPDSLPSGFKNGQRITKPLLRWFCKPVWCNTSPKTGSTRAQQKVHDILHVKKV